MATIVGMCNEALQMLKSSKTITSLTEGTKEANACEILYPSIRDLVLEAHTWNFATKRVKLARMTETPVFGYKYFYELPADFIRVNEVFANSSGYGSIEYNLEQGRIATDSQNVYLLYVFRVEDPNLMIPSFRTAVSRLLASRLATAIGNSASAADSHWDKYEKSALPAAKSIDGLQDMPDKMPQSEWVTARYGGYDIDPGQPE